MAYPSSVTTFTTKTDGVDYPQAEHVNTLQTEMNAVETGLLSGLQHDLRPLTTNAQDLGTSAAFWRTVRVRTSIILGQSTANYTVSWSNPSAARALTIPDPGGNDAFAFIAATQTFTNKTLTAPVLGGTVTGTYTLGGTPTLTAPVLGGTVTGTYTLGGTPTIAGATISGAAGATPTANVLYTDSIVKGWLETSGAGAWTIDDDLNVSSITDNNAGDFTINWATAFANDDYVIAGAAITANAEVVQESVTSAKSTTAVRIDVKRTNTAGLVDPTVGVCVLAIGDQ